MRVCLRDKVKKSEYDKKYYMNNSVKSKERAKKYRKDNQEKLRLYQRDKEHKREYDKKYRVENRLKLNAYIKNKKHTNVQYKLGVLLRCRLNKAIRKNQKIGSAIRDLGCTINELKLYIEWQFQDGMNWDNWTIEGWHIDHKIPLTFFDLTDRAQLLQACHYTNLQPMWASKNLSKGGWRGVKPMLALC